jgi:uncharacterized protein YeaO (DUF488 family)
MIKLKRAYDPLSRDDGKRILIDRLWPRGLKKEKALVDEWMKDLAPSRELRVWFGHDPKKWTEFKKRFFLELKEQKDLLEKLSQMGRKGTVTLLYGSKEEKFNNAVALKEYIETKLKVKQVKKAA